MMQQKQTEAGLQASQNARQLIEDTSKEFHTVFRWVLSGLIEAFFIVCWVLIQWLLNKYILEPFALSGIDKITLTIAQWGFAIATLAPIIFFTAKLVFTMAIRTFREITKDLSNEYNSTDV